MDGTVFLSLGINWLTIAHLTGTFEFYVFNFWIPFVYHINEPLVWSISEKGVFPILEGSILSILFFRCTELFNFNGPICQDSELFPVLLRFYLEICYLYLHIEVFMFVEMTF